MVIILLVVGGVGYLVVARHLVSKLPSLVEMRTLVEGVHSGNVLWRRPMLAPNGRAWPRVSGYVEGYAQLNVGGIATVVVDNSGGGGTALLTRCGAAGRSALIQVLLFSPSLAPVIHVTVTRSADGEQFMGWTVPMYASVKGKTQRREF